MLPVIPRFDVKVSRRNRTGISTTYNLPNLTSSSIVKCTLHFGPLKCQGHPNYKRHTDSPLLLAVKMKTDRFGFTQGFRVSQSLTSIKRGWISFFVDVELLHQRHFTATTCLQKQGFFSAIHTVNCFSLELLLTQKG